MTGRLNKAINQFCVPDSSGSLRDHGSDLRFTKDHSTQETKTKKAVVRSSSEISRVVHLTGKLAYLNDASNSCLSFSYHHHYSYSFIKKERNNIPEQCMHHTPSPSSKSSERNYHPSRRPQSNVQFLHWLVILTTNHHPLHSSQQACRSPTSSQSWVPARPAPFADSSEQGF